MHIAPPITSVPQDEGLRQLKHLTLGGRAWASGAVAFVTAATAKPNKNPINMPFFI